MEITLSFSEINWLSVIVASLLAFALGGVWYSPLLFTKAWQADNKFTEADRQGANMPLIFGTTFILNVISAIFLDLLIGSNSTLVSGLMTGLVVSIAWIATAIGINYLFVQKTFRLFLIDAGYYVTYYAIIGAVLGAW